MISAAAEVQRRLWGTDPRAWAELAESHNRPLFEAVLDAAAVGPGTAVLDVGCGSGLTLVLAAERGAVPSGVDISPGLLDIARDRLPQADLREADMESLPFGDAVFDAVTGVNAFQFAGDLRWHLRNVIIGAPANWARTALEWNLANDERFGPHTPGGCTTCLGAVTIDSATSNVTRNVGYYILGHASRFVPPGSVRVASTLTGTTSATGLYQVAYRTPAGRYVLVTMNDGNSAQRLNIVYEGKTATHSLGAGEAATYVW